MPIYIPSLVLFFSGNFPVTKPQAHVILFSGMRIMSMYMIATYRTVIISIFHSKAHFLLASDKQVKNIYIITQ